MLWITNPSQQAVERGCLSQSCRLTPVPRRLLQNLLPKIVELWHKLHVPLIHRSRFYLAFRGREVFYFEAEKRRLAWLQSEMGNPEGSDPMAKQAAKRALARNLRKLDVIPPCWPA